MQTFILNKTGGGKTLVPLRIKIPTLSPTATQTAHYERTSSSSRLRLPQFRCARKEAKNNPGKPETKSDTATQMVCSFRWNGGGSRSGSFAHCCQPLHYCTPNTPLLGSSKLGTPIIIISFGRGAGLGDSSTFCITIKFTSNINVVHVIGIMVVAITINTNHEFISGIIIPTHTPLAVRRTWSACSVVQQRTMVASHTLR